MDNVIESTSSLLQTVLDLATQKLIDAWANHNSEAIATFAKLSLIQLEPLEVPVLD